MPLRPMYGWGITKYNPDYRDERGTYLKDEWTSISDIGTVYEGQPFTYEQYRKVEDAYVSTALHFISAANLNGLRLSALASPHFPQARRNDLRDIVFDPSAVRRGMIVSGKSLDNICRLALREIVGCQLTAGNGFHIHFGYDYYMYIGSPDPSKEAIAYGERQGLYIDEMRSPYLGEGEA